MGIVKVCHVYSKDQISTGGGDSLEIMKVKKLPGIEALNKNEEGDLRQMRNKVIAGNWKMQKTVKEATDFLSEVSNLKTAEHVESSVCDSFVHLPALTEKAAGTNIHIAAQNMFFKVAGAFNGIVSRVMLTDIGVTYVVICHSERREYFNETDETVNKKTVAAFDHGLTPIVCVGETLEQREANETLTHIKEQVKAALESLKAEQIKETIIA